MSSSPLPRSAVLSRIPSLDGLRALSIFLVMGLHTLQRFGLTHQVGFGWYALLNGALGVQIFFVISGFLITSLLLKEHDNTGSVSLRGFYLRRAFRILPPLYFYIGIIVLLGLWGRIQLQTSDVVSSLFFFHNYSLNAMMWSLEHLWSISLEEQFYLVWPFLLVFFLRRPGTAGRFSASVIPIAILILSPVGRMVLGMQKNPLLHKIGISYLNFDFLMYGCVVALLQHTPRFEEVYRRATRIWWLPPAVIAVCSILTARFQNYFDLPVGYTVNGAAIAIFLLWCTRNPSTAVGRILNWTPIVKIGVLSYSIYLWQTLFIHHRNVSVFQSASSIMVFPVSWLCILLAGAFSYYVIEQPSLRLRSRVVKSLHLYASRRNLARKNQPTLKP